MVGYAHTRSLERIRLDLSFLAGGLRVLHFPLVSLTFLTGFIVEAMLAGRLWLQMTNADATATGLQAALLSITDVLVSPFSGGESSAVTTRASGVFEYATLVAVEAYLIATLVAVLSIVALRLLAFAVKRLIALKRNRELRSRHRLAGTRIEVLKVSEPEISDSGGAGSSAESSVQGTHPIVPQHGEVA